MRDLTRRLLPLAVAGALVSAACGAGAEAEELRSDVDRTQVDPAGAEALPAVVAATDALGVDLVALAPEGENVVASPASAVVALAMLGEGAQGESAAELDALLGAVGTDRTDAVNALSAALTPWAGDPAVVQEEELPEEPVVHVANNVVIDDDAEVVSAYLDTLASGYGAGVQSTDLAGSDGKEVLDAWVRENSGGLMEESAIEPNADLRLVLQNAVVLAGRWESPFTPEATSSQPFTLADGTEVDVDTMHKKSYLSYAEVDGWQAVRLPYTGGGLYADVLLPPEGADVADADADLLGQFAAELAIAESVELELAMPKVDIDTEADLLPLLQEHAPSLISAASADLTGISTQQPPLFIGQAKQQAVLVVDEEGTVAAAVTEIGAEAGSAPAAAPIEFIVDRPHLIRIAVDVDSVDGLQSWPLFLARVADPRS